MREPRDIVRAVRISRDDYQPEIISPGEEIQNGFLFSFVCASGYHHVLSGVDTQHVHRALSCLVRLGPQIVVFYVSSDDYFVFRQIERRYVIRLLLIPQTEKIYCLERVPEEQAEPLVASDALLREPPVCHSNARPE